MYRMPRLGQPNTGPLYLKAADAGAITTLDFATSLPGAVTFTRGSEGSYFNSSGVLSWATTDTARIDYDPVTLGGYGLLVERSRTNLVLQSEVLGTTWLADQASVSANAITSPDGTTNADSLNENSAAAANHYIYQTLTFADSSVYAASIFMRPINRIWGVTAVRIQSSTTPLGAYFNVSAGSIGANSAIAAFLRDVSGSWYRTAVTVNSSSGATSERIIVYIAEADGDITFTGLNQASLYLWGGQCELGGYPTSYIRTTTGSVTRSADVATFTPFANPSSYLVQGRTAVGGGVDQVALQLDDTTANERVTLFRNTSDEMHFVVADGGVQQCDLDLGTVADDTDFTVAFRLKAGAISAYLVGGTRQDGPGTETLPTVTVGRVGADLSGNQLDGHILAISNDQTDLTNGQLEAWADGA